MKKFEPVHVMLIALVVGSVVIGFTAGVVAAFLYAVMSVGSYASINLMTDLVYSIATERIYRRDRVLSDYVPARGGNWWLTLGVTALFVWAAYGYGAQVSHVPAVVMLVWVVPSVLAGTVVPVVRARWDAKAFRVEVDASRDVSLERRFWEIVDNDKEV